MYPFSFRLATPADLDRILEIYSRILDLEEAGVTTIGWVRHIYPTRETVQQGLDAGDLFVLEAHQTVVAAARINQIQMPEYAKAAWEHPEAPTDRVMVIHTLVVDPNHSGKGCGTAFVRFYESYAAENNCPFLRMDTNAKNMTARRLYAHLGYREAGIVPCTFHNICGVDLVCLEKTVSV